jgi:DegV family protein with EDD domain
MKDYIIATASTCDLDHQWLSDHDIPFISYTFEVDGEIYVDNCDEETTHIIYQKMREGKMPNTSQITAYAYYEFFKDLLKEGKPVIFVDMDKAISNSYNNSLTGKEMVLEKIPDAELYILDTRCITTGLGFLVKHMARLRDEGKTCQEVIEWANENALKIAHRFVVDDLQWLRKGGRLSNSSAIVGTLLAIKPLIYIPDDGTLVAYEKVHGKKKAVHELLESAAKEIDADQPCEIVLSHADCPEDGEKWKAMVQERFPKADVTLQELGPTIGCHIGPGFLSIVYFAEKRQA